MQACSLLALISLGSMVTAQGIEFRVLSQTLGNKWWEGHSSFYLVSGVHMVGDS